MASTQSIEFVSPLGNTINFTDQINYYVPRGKSGFHGQPFSLIDRMTPFVAGGVLTGIQVQPRTIEIPVYVIGSTRSTFLSRLEYLARNLDPAHGDGLLKYTRPSGQLRQITCRLANIFEDSTEQKLYTPKSTLIVLQFKAYDPYWYPTQAITANYGVSTPSAFFPFFPLNVSADGLSGGTTLVNIGDAPAWPIWEISGPGSDFALINNTTGYRLDMSTTSISLGEVLTIDTRPGHKTADVDGTSVFDEIDNTSTLWPLIVGNNSVELQLTGGTGDTEVVVSFYPPYNSA